MSRCGSDCGSGAKSASRGSSSGNVPVAQQFAKPCVQRGLGAAIVGQGQQTNHAPAGFALIEGLEQRVEAAAVGVAREQLIAVDEVQQRHRLAVAGHG